MRLATCFKLPRGCYGHPRDLSIDYFLQFDARDFDDIKFMNGKIDVI